MQRQGGEEGDWGLFLPKRKAPLWTLGVLVAVDLAYVTLALLFAHRFNPWFRQVYTATGGLVTPTLLLNLPRLALGLLVVFGVARLRPPDLAFCRRSLLGGGVALAGAWALVQALTTAQALAADRPLRPDPRLEAVGALAFLGPLVAQVLGNALHEEVVYRGVLLGQAWRRTLDRWPQAPALALVLALLLSQSAFAMMHLPIRLLWEGMEPARLFLNLLLMGGVGSALGLVLLATRSLPAVIALHALLNAPTALVDSPLPAGGASLGAVLTATLAVTLVSRRRMRPSPTPPGTLHPSSGIGG